MTFDILFHDFGPYPIIIVIAYGPVILYYIYKIEVPVSLLVSFALALIIITIYFCYNPYTWEIGFIIKENVPKPEISILIPPEEETPSINEKGQKILMFFFVLRVIKFLIS